MKKPGQLTLAQESLLRYLSRQQPKLQRRRFTGIRAVLIRSGQITENLMRLFVSNTAISRKPIPSPIAREVKVFQTTNHGFSGYAKKMGEDHNVTTRQFFRASGYLLEFQLDRGRGREKCPGERIRIPLFLRVEILSLVKNFRSPTGTYEVCQLVSSGLSAPLPRMIGVQ